jgi:prefoldin subunit 5
MSLGMSVTGVREAVRAIETVKTGFTGDSAWIVGVGAEYGAYVELGTSNMDAQPYLFPAARYVMRTRFDELQAQAQTLDGLVELLAVEIEAEAKRRAPVDTGNLRASIEAFPAGAQP